MLQYRLHNISLLAVITFFSAMTPPLFAQSAGTAAPAQGASSQTAWVTQPTSQENYSTKVAPSPVPQKSSSMRDKIEGFRNASPGVLKLMESQRQQQQILDAHTADSAYLRKVRANLRMSHRMVLLNINVAKEFLDDNWQGEVDKRAVGVMEQRIAEVQQESLLWQKKCSAEAAKSTGTGVAAYCDAEKAKLDAELNEMNRLLNTYQERVAH